MPQLLCGLSLGDADCQVSADHGLQIALMDGSVKVVERIYKQIYTVIKYVQYVRYIQARRTAGAGMRSHRQ